MTDPWPDAPEEKRPRGWGVKFGEAFRGVALGVRGESSFFAHFFFATLAAVLAALLGCTRLEWALVALAVGGVLAMELMNSALERLFHGLDDDTKNRLTGVLDISAGAVLLASATAAAVGALVFVPKFLGG